MAYPTRYRRRPAYRKRTYGRGTYSRVGQRRYGGGYAVRAPRRRSYARRPRRAVSRVPKQLALSQFARAQINPFDPSVKRVRVPDTSTAPSSSIFSYDESGVSMSTTNANCIYAWPGTLAFTAATNNVGVSSWTWPAGYAGGTAISSLTNIQNQYHLWRPVAHGMRISCGLAPTAATGFCHVCLYAMPLYDNTTWDLPTSISQMTELPHYKRVTLASLTQTPMIVCNKYLDETAFRYTSTESSELILTTTNTFQVSRQWMGILVAVDGAPSGSSSINVEIIGHYEGQSRAGTINTDRPAQTANADDMQRTSHVVQDVTAAGMDEPSYWDRTTAAATDVYNRVYQGQLTTEHLCGPSFDASMGVNPSLIPDSPC